jgi:hypothetical protein
MRQIPTSLFQNSRRCSAEGPACPAVFCYLEGPGEGADIADAWKRTVGHDFAEVAAPASSGRTHRTRADYRKFIPEVCLRTVVFFSQAPDTISIAQAMYVLAPYTLHIRLFRPRGMDTATDTAELYRGLHR